MTGSFLSLSFVLSLTATTTPQKATLGSGFQAELTPQDFPYDIHLRKEEYMQIPFSDKTIWGQVSDHIYFNDQVEYEVGGNCSIIWEQDFKEWNIIYWLTVD